MTDKKTGLFSFMRRSQEPTRVEVVEEVKQPEAISNGKPDIKAYYSGPTSSYGGPVYSIGYNGETELGGMGPMVRYILDHEGLRVRSWQLFLDSDVAQTLFQRISVWKMGTGLTLQCEPVNEVLESEGIKIAPENFNKITEARFKVFADSLACDYKELTNLHGIAKEGDKTVDVGGDLLVVLRLIKGKVKVQIIDGMHIKTPMTGMTSTGLDVVNPNTGNVIRHGVELNAQGGHEAYWVAKNLYGLSIGEFERIPAKVPGTRLRQAAMWYGLKYRIDNVRAMPLISAVMETIAEMGRYKKAALGAAEEQAKIALAIEHEKGTNDENPFSDRVVKAKTGALGPQSDLPADINGQELANNVMTTTKRTTVNLTPGAKIVTVESKGNLYFKEFYEVNFMYICAAVGFPFEVILSVFNGSYSSSRGTIKDFEHTLLVKRAEGPGAQFYQLVYEYWLYVQILQGKIKAPGYLKAFDTGDETILAAYNKASWNGDNVPHIDPVKEVNAIRAMMGKGTEHLPLITQEIAVQMIGKGDVKHITTQVGEELKEAETAGIEREEVNPEPVVPEPSDNK